MILLLNSTSLVHKIVLISKIILLSYTKLSWNRKKNNFSKWKTVKWENCFGRKSQLPVIVSCEVMTYLCGGLMVFFCGFISHLITQQWKNHSCLMWHFYGTFKHWLMLYSNISLELPYNDYFEYFGPDFKLHISPSNMANQNTTDYLEKIKWEC